MDFLLIILSDKIWLQYLSLSEEISLKDLAYVDSESEKKRIKKRNIERINKASRAYVCCHKRLRASEST